MRIFLATTFHNMEKSLFYDTLVSMEHEVIHHGWKFEDTYTQEWVDHQKDETNVHMLNELLLEHEHKEPVDLFFGYMSNRTTHGDIINKLKQITGIPCVNFSWDDRLKVHMQSDIAKHFDLCWTTDKRVRFMDKDISSVKAYELMGAKAIYLPAGANPDLFHSSSNKPSDLPPSPKKYPISFVGSGGGGYNYRDEALVKLKGEFGDKLHLFGGIVGNKVTTEEYVDIIHNSQIILGFSGSSGADKICSDYTCIKGRDFEVPMAGGFYLTEHNPDLEDIYEIGSEIATYKSYPDLVAKLRHYLKYFQEAQGIALKGCDRARKDHTMQRRFEVIFKELGLC